MTDLELCREVWDGGMGDHPKLRAALQAYRRLEKEYYEAGIVDHKVVYDDLQRRMNGGD